jgi:hypothetical protein
MNSKLCKKLRRKARELLGPNAPERNMLGIQRTVWRWVAEVDPVTKQLTKPEYKQVVRVQEILDPQSVHGLYKRMKRAVRLGAKLV